MKIKKNYVSIFITCFTFLLSQISSAADLASYDVHGTFESITSKVIELKATAVKMVAESNDFSGMLDSDEFEIPGPGKRILSDEHELLYVGKTPDDTLFLLTRRRPTATVEFASVLRVLKLVDDQYTLEKEVTIRGYHESADGVLNAWFDPTEEIFMMRVTYRKTGHFVPKSPDSLLVTDMKSGKFINNFNLR